MGSFQVRDEARGRRLERELELTNHDGDPREDDVGELLGELLDRRLHEAQDLFAHYVFSGFSSSATRH
jgi:hypothetical protein